MGSCSSHLTPFPPNYISLTFRPTNELWICQGPPHLIDFIRSLFDHIWPHVDYQERHCNAHAPYNHSADVQPHPPLRNTVFQIPMEPFTFSPIHQSTEVAEPVYRFVMLLVAYLYSMDYEIVSAGHFIRGTEASTCLFRCRVDHQQMGNFKRLMGSCQLRPPTKSKCLQFRHSKAMDCDLGKSMIVIGLEGWNRIYCLNMTKVLVTGLINDLQKIWPERIISQPIGSPMNHKNTGWKNAAKDVPDSDRPLSHLIEFKGHPWDSYKENSDLTPYLIITLIRVLEDAGYRVASRANIRGLLDTLFFFKDESLIRERKNTVKICFSLCHQNTIRVYGGSPKFCSWVAQLLQQLWISGVASEKQVSFSPCEHTNPDSESAELHFTEIKLNGTPFCTPEWNKDNFLAAQYMIGRLIGVLSFVDWQLIVSMNVYSSPYDKGLLIFEKELVPDDEERLIDLEVVELRKHDGGEIISGNVKNFDLLRPICFTSYDLDRLCLLGGSREFLQMFNIRFLRLFDNTEASNTFFQRFIKANQKKRDTAEFRDKYASISDNWIASRYPFQPQLVHKVFIGAGNPYLCLTSPLRERLALTAIAELDPNNLLEYTTNYQMWASSSCWPPKMFYKTSDRAKNFFYLSQIPLAVLCWAHEFINAVSFSDSDDNPEQEIASNTDEIAKIESSKQLAKTPSSKRPYKNGLVACMDYASTVRNAPPAWIYIIREDKQPVVVEPKPVTSDQ